MELFWRKSIVAAIMLPVFLFISYQGGWWLFIPMSLIALIGMGEYYSATLKKGHRPAVMLGFIIGLCILAVTQFSLEDYREGALLGQVIVMVGVTLMTQFINRENQSAVNNSAVTVFGVVWVPLMLSFMLRLRQFDLPEALHYPSAGAFWHNAGAVMVIVLPVWLCDIMANAVGQAWGKRKLAPTISPNKTVEGAAGGFLGGVAGALIVSSWVGLPWFHALLLGSMISIVGQLGDLGKSTLKRDLQIKDFGLLFGAHGGVLDRFDAVLFSLPLGYLYLWLFFYTH